MDLSKIKICKKGLHNYFGNRYDQCKECKKLATSAWTKKNLQEKCASTVKYQTSKLRRTPPWLTKEHFVEMQKIYKSRPEGFHVDHIVPLQEENVSGLHVPWNLQILSSSKNSSKKNRF